MFKPSWRGKEKRKKKEIKESRQKQERKKHISTRRKGSWGTRRRVSDKVERLDGS